jgi:hypothetical protein
MTPVIERVKFNIEMCYSHVLLWHIHAAIIISDSKIIVIACWIVEWGTTWHVSALNMEQFYLHEISLDKIKVTPGTMW